VIFSFGLSTLLHTVTAQYSGIQLATASRSLQEPWQIGTLLGWKVVELFVAWVAGYDCTLQLLSHIDKLNRTNLVYLSQTKTSPP
jgi:hypothetical protein